MASIFELFKKLEKPPESTLKIEWIVAGLGNPGKKYENSRHNAGFNALDVLARTLNARANTLKFRAFTGKAAIGGHGALLLKPQTFMNLSGESVREAAAFYKIPPDRIIVIFDDAALPPGTLRVRRKGSDGGHNGIKSVISHLRSDQFPRIKIGVGAPPFTDYDMADWVLGSFSKDDLSAVGKTLESAAAAAALIVEHGVEAAMQKFN